MPLGVNSFHDGPRAVHSDGTSPNFLLPPPTGKFSLELWYPENVRHFRDNWGWHVFRLSCWDDAMDIERLVQELTAITSEGCVAIVENHFPTGHNHRPNGPDDPKAGYDWANPNSQEHVDFSTYFYDHIFKPAVQAMPAHLRSQVVYEIWNEPYVKSLPGGAQIVLPDEYQLLNEQFPNEWRGTKKLWYDTADRIVQHVRDDGWVHPVMVCAPFWGQDRARVNQNPASDSAIVEYGAQLVQDHGQIIWDMHMYGEWFPEYNADGMTTPEQWIEYTDAVLATGGALVLGEFANTNVPSAIELNPPIKPGGGDGWRRSRAGATFMLGAAMRLGMSRKVVPILWSPARAFSPALTHHTQPSDPLAVYVDNANDRHNGHAGKAAGRGSVQLFFADVLETGEYPATLRPIYYVMHWWWKLNRDQADIDWNWLERYRLLNLNVAGWQLPAAATAAGGFWKDIPASMFVDADGTEDLVFTVDFDQTLGYSIVWERTDDDGATWTELATSGLTVTLSDFEFEPGSVEAQVRVTVTILGTEYTPEFPARIRPRDVDHGGVIPQTGDLDDYVIRYEAIEATTGGANQYTWEGADSVSVVSDDESVAYLITEGFTETAVDGVPQHTDPLAPTAYDLVDVSLGNETASTPAGTETKQRLVSYGLRLPANTEYVEIRDSSNRTEVSSLYCRDLVTGGNFVVGHQNFVDPLGDNASVSASTLIHVNNGFSECEPSTIIIGGSAQEGFVMEVVGLAHTRHQRMSISHEYRVNGVGDYVPILRADQLPTYELVGPTDRSVQAEAGVVPDLALGERIYSKNGVVV